MNDDGTYQVSQSLAIQVREGGLVATTSVSRLPAALRPEAIPVLQAFAAGNTRSGALAALAREWDLDEKDFHTVVDTLVHDGLLLSPDGPAPATSGFASLQMQHFMVNDTVRVLAYRSAIAAHARGRTVVEVGCGTGLLSLFAAQAGARRVIAIEETTMAGLAREMVRANGFEDIVEVICANSRDVVLDERGDLLIHEIIGVDPFSENLVPYIEDARARFLVPHARLLPQRLEVLCAGVQVAADEETITRATAVRQARELAGLYGLDLAPYLRRLEDGPEFRRGARPGTSRFAHPILSRECRLLDLDLNADASGAGAPVHADLEIESDGELNSLLLYFRAHLDDHIRLTNSPWTPRTSWGWVVRDLPRAVQVRAGDRLRVQARIDNVLGREQLEVGLA